MKEPSLFLQYLEPFMKTVMQFLLHGFFVREASLTVCRIECKDAAFLINPEHNPRTVCNERLDRP